MSTARTRGADDGIRAMELDLHCRGAHGDFSKRSVVFAPHVHAVEKLMAAHNLGEDRRVARHLNSSLDRRRKS
jgi:hypothetical protein